MVKMASKAARALSLGYSAATLASVPWYAALSHLVLGLCATACVGGEVDWTVVQCG